MSGHTVDNLICTSVDDLKATLPSITDVELLNAALTKAEGLGHKTRTKVLARRIKQLEEETGLKYGDGTQVELWDVTEVQDADFEPEAAKAIKLGKRKIQIEWENTYIKPSKAWVAPGLCELVSRDG